MQFVSSDWNTALLFLIGSFGFLRDDVSGATHQACLITTRFMAWQHPQKWLTWVILLFRDEGLLGLHEENGNLSVSKRECSGMIWT